MTALHVQLRNIGINAQELQDAAIRSATTTEGYDPQYGRSAIRTYRKFIDPKSKHVELTRVRDCDANGTELVAAAARCARQIDFLAKRFRSHEADWVRHTDVQDPDEDIPIQHKRKPFPLIVVLDNVRSAFNVGSIFRTADACNCCLVLTTGITPHPNGSGAEKVAKSALGADRVVPTLHFPTTKEALEYLRRDWPEVSLIAMETTRRSLSYTHVVYPGKHYVLQQQQDKHDKEETSTSDLQLSLQSAPGTALFLGNEVTGVDTEIMPLLDTIVEIPMFGAKNSLNIAACAPVVMYEILRQWGVMDLDHTDNDK